MREIIPRPTGHQRAKDIKYGLERLEQIYEQAQLTCKGVIDCTIQGQYVGGRFTREEKDRHFDLVIGYLARRLLEIKADLRAHGVEIEPGAEDTLAVVARFLSYWPRPSEEDAKTLA